MPKRITYDELKCMLSDIEISDKKLAKYFTGDPDHSTAMNPALQINREFVDIGPSDYIKAEGDTLMSAFNGYARARRHARYKREIAFDPQKPIVLMEGDSHCQFPLLIDDIGDALMDRFGYACNCVSAAGDTLQNMVIKGQVEYPDLIANATGNVKAFVFSGAGNDVIGTDISTGKSVLERIVLPFKPGRSAAAYIDNPDFKKTIAFIESSYLTVIKTVRALNPNIKIVIYGYDYVIPGGYTDDPRRPSYASNDQWLGRPFKKLGINDQALRVAIVREMIDRLYMVLFSAASSASNVLCVDARGTNPTVDLWNDEIHPTDKGFRNVAALFHAAIKT